MQTNASVTEDSLIATYPPKPTPRSRFLLRSEKGFLRASHEGDGPPIRVIPTPESATRFVDLITAVRRARVLADLGWRDLRIVEMRFPSA